MFLAGSISSEIVQEGEKKHDLTAAISAFNATEFITEKEKNIFNSIKTNQQLPLL